MKNKRTNRYAHLIFIGPAFFFYTMFWIIPTLVAIWISFTRWNGISWAHIKWAGLANYFKLFNDRFFYTALQNNLLFVLFYIVNAKTINFVVYYYLGEGIYFNSKGAVPRFLPSLVSALLFLLYLRDKITNIHEKRVFTIFSYLVLIICPTIFIASTFLDRLNIYFVPLQAYALTTFISHINNLSVKKLITSIVILFYAILLLIWLFFGSHSWKWIPYEIFPIQYCTGEVFNQEFCDYFNRSNRPK